MSDATCDSRQPTCDSRERRLSTFDSRQPGDIRHSTADSPIVARPSNVGRRLSPGRRMSAVECRAGCRPSAVDCRTGCRQPTVECRLSHVAPVVARLSIVASPNITSTPTFVCRCNSDTPDSSRTDFQRSCLSWQQPCASGRHTSGTSAHRSRLSQHPAPPDAPSSNAR